MTTTCPVCRQVCPVNEFMAYRRHEDCFAAVITSNNRGVKRNDPARSFVAGFILPRCRKVVARVQCERLEND